MRKNPLFIFILVLFFSTFSAIAFIQSRTFADLAKKTVSKFLPNQLGVKGNFDRVQVQFFPPGIALSEPSVLITGENPAGIPIGTDVNARRLEVSFHALQVLSGKIKINEIKVVDGVLKTKLKIPEKSPEKKEKKLTNISWKDLFKVRIEKVTLVNTSVDLEVDKTAASFLANEVNLIQTQKGDLKSVQLNLNISSLKVNHPFDVPFPKEADSLLMLAEMNSTGLFLNQFRLEKKDTFIDFKGKILGDVFAGEKLKLNSEMKLKGDFQTLFDPLSKNEKPSGQFEFDGKVTSNDIEKWKENSLAVGKFSTSHFKYQVMEVDSATFEGSYNAFTKDLKVNQALLKTNNRDKKAPSTLGSGGEIKVGSFETKIDSGQPIKVSVEVNKAHLNWLFSPIIKDLYALDGRATGKSDLIITPPFKNRPFLVEGNIDWAFDYLQLDNQKFGRNKPLSKIFVIPGLKIVGKMTASEQKLQFLEMKALIKESNLLVDGTIEIGENPSFDLRGGGAIDLSEIKELVGIPAKGKGQMSIYVHGPSENVIMDFDNDMHDFEFIHLMFGDFRGRITYSDLESRLKLQKLDCNKGSTRYLIDGYFQFDEKDKMDLTAQIGSGDIKEFLSIFKNLTQDLWWFPESLTGSFRGDFRIFGGIALNEMKINSKILGEGFDFYGEHFQKTDFEFNYDQSKYYISNLQAIKRRGQIFADLSFSEKEGLDWKLKTNEFQLNDFDFMNRLKIPMRGNWKLNSSGKGKYPELLSSTKVELNNTIYRGSPLKNSVAHIETKDKKALFNFEVFGDQVILNSKYALEENKPSELEIIAKSLDFSPLIFALNSSLTKDENLVSKVSGKYNLRFLSQKSEEGSGEAELSQYDLKKTGIHFRNEEPIRFKIDKGSFDIPQFILVGNEGELISSLKSQSGLIKGRMKGSIDLGILEFITSAVESTDGLMDVDFHFGGTLKKPEAIGSGEILSGLIRLPAMDTPIEAIRGGFTFTNGLLQLKSLMGNFATGKISAEGSVECFTDKLPILNLSTNLIENKLKVFPFQVAKVSGKVDLKGDSIPYPITGKIFIDYALSREKIANAAMRAPGFKASRFSPDETESKNLDRPLFKLGIDVSAPGKIMVQNELMDLEAKGELKLVNTLELPRVIGKAQSVQGKLLFKDRSFQIQSGWMEFDSPTVINPKFEMVATTEVSNRKIQMFASGRLNAEKFKVEFTSNPPMSDQDILTLLALGATSEDLKNSSSADRAAYQQGEAASLILHSLDFNREIKNKTGFQIGVDQAVDTTVGQSIFRKTTDADSSSAPKVVIRRDFGKRFGFLAGTTVGVGSNIQREFNAEMRVTPSFSVLGVWDTFEGVNSDESRRSSYGFDLKLQKRFK